MKTKFLILALLASLAAAAQPNCFTIHVGNAAANPGDTVRLPVTARDFRQMLSYQFAFAWNPADLKYIRADQSGSPLSYMGFGSSEAGQGFLRTLWVDYDVVGVTLPDDTRLFTLEFKVLATNPGYYPVGLVPEIPGFAYEIIRYDNEFLPLAFQAGGVWVGGAPAAPLGLTQFCTTASTCSAQQGGISIEASGGVPPYQYAWSGPGGFTSSDETLVNIVTGTYGLTVTDQAGQTLVAGAALPYKYSGLYAYPDSISPAWCHQPSGCATIRISNGHPPYTLTWPDGGFAAKRCDLSAGEYKVTVSDALGCSQIATVSMYEEDKLDASTDAVYSDCRFGTLGSVSVTPKNGWAPYTYQWSNGAQSASVGNLTSKEYTVTVTDAAGCQYISAVDLKDYGTLDWSLSLYQKGDCQPGQRYLILGGYDFGARAEFPVTLRWSTGTVDVIQELDSDSLSALHQLQHGRYTVTVTDAQGCSKEVSRAVYCPLPDPEFTHPNVRFYIDSKADEGQVDSCVDVRVQNFKGIQAAHFTLDWKYMKFKEIRSMATPAWITGITASNFKTEQTGVEFTWEAPTSKGLTLWDDSRLFEVCFTKPFTSPNRVEFAAGKEDPYVRDTSGLEHGFIGKNGWARFSAGSSEYDAIDSFNLSLPNCLQDGSARIQLDPWGWYPYLFLTYTHDGVKYENANFGGLDFAAPGHYQISGGAANTSSTFYAFVPPALPMIECVWPGDADNNNAVNHFDLLYLGLGMGQSGLPRAGAQAAWAGQDAPEWPLSTPLRAVNYKNLDANGDGWVDLADTAVIAENWERVISIYRDNPYACPIESDQAFPGPALQLQADSLIAGIPNELPLVLGQAGQAADDVHGLAFSIVYNPKLLEGDVVFLPDSSWLGDPDAGLLCMQRNFPGQRRLDVALTRTDGLPAGGYGPIGRLRLTAKPMSGSGTEQAAFSITQAIALSPSEIPIPLSGASAAFPLKPAPVSATGTRPDPGRISLAPNPASDAVYVRSDVPVQALEILDANGVLCLRQQYTGADHCTLSTAGLPEGAYVVRVLTREGVVCKRMAVLR